MFTIFSMPLSSSSLSLSASKSCCSRSSSAGSSSADILRLGTRVAAADRLTSRCEPALPAAAWLPGRPPLGRTPTADCRGRLLPSRRLLLLLGMTCWGRDGVADVRPRDCELSSEGSWSMGILSLPRSRCAMASKWPSSARSKSSSSSLSDACLGIGLEAACLDVVTDIGGWAGVGGNGGEAGAGFVSGIVGPMRETSLGGPPPAVAELGAAAAGAGCATR
ncbi:hypothetical protein V8C86DRAFT_2483743 [Haematococcus lacustris]